MKNLYSLHVPFDTPVKHEVFKTKNVSDCKRRKFDTPVKHEVSKTDLDEIKFDPKFDTPVKHEVSKTSSQEPLFNYRSLVSALRILPLRTLPHH